MQIWYTFFDFSQKTGHSRLLNRNTQTSRFFTCRGCAKQEHGFQRKRAGIVSRNRYETAVFRPAGQESGHGSQPAAGDRGFAASLFQRLPMLPLLTQGPHLLPGGGHPAGLSAVGKNRRVICRRSPSGSSTPMRRLPVSPTAQAHHQAFPLCTGNVQKPCTGIPRKPSAPLPPVSLPAPGYLSMSRHLPKKSACTTLCGRRIEICRLRQRL